MRSALEACLTLFLALATLFADDADFVNVGATHWKGRNQIRAQHAARLGQFMESVWTITGITVQFLERDIALVHIAWGLRGDKDPDGTPRQPREGLFTWVVVRQGGDWRVRAAQNTNRGNLPTPRDAPPDQSVERTLWSPRERSDPTDGTWDKDAAIHTMGTDEKGVAFDSTPVFRRRQAQ